MQIVQREIAQIAIRVLSCVLESAMKRVPIALIV